MSEEESNILMYSAPELAKRHPELRYISLPQIVQVVEEKVPGSNNITKISIYSSKDKLFRVAYCKEFANRAGNESLTRAYGRSPPRLFDTEVNAYEDLTDTPVGKWLPKPLGKDARNKKLYLSEMRGKDSRSKILEARLNNDEPARQMILFDAAKKYGIIEGALYNQRQHFAENPDYSIDMRLERVTDYIGTILKYNNEDLAAVLSSRAMMEIARDKYSSRGINITHALAEITNQSAGLVNTIRPSVGDARLRHLLTTGQGFGILDIEYMSGHPRVHTLITLTNMEAGISRPNDADLTNFIATYLAFYDASKKQHAQTTNKKHPHRNAIKNLNRKINKDTRNDSPHRRIVGEAGGKEIVDRVTLEFLAGDVEENLHMYATNLRTDPARLVAWTDGISDYDLDDMLKYRLNRICGDLDYFVANSERFKGTVGEETTIAFQSLFTNYALLLDRLDIVSINNALLRPHGGPFKKRTA